MKLKHKMILLFISIILLLNIGIGYYSIRTMKDKVIGAAQEKLKSDAALGLQLLESKFPGNWSVSGNYLYKGSIKMNERFEIVDEIGKLTGDTVTIFQNDTRVNTNVINEKKERAINTKASDIVIETVLKQGKPYIGKANVVGTWNQTVYEPIKDASGEIIGIWYVGVPNTPYDLLSKEFQDKIIIFTLLGTIISSLIVWFVTDRLTKPLQALENGTKKMATGDFSETISISTSDEIGSLAKAFNHLQDNMNIVLSQISNASDQVAAGSNQLSASSISLSQGATEQASTIQELTALLSEISSQTNQNAKNADNANQLTDQAKLNASAGNQQMQEMLLAMNNINTSSKDIHKIIKVIDSIAFQTNILALNAAVEAAKAGSRGKSFAVVAEEVRNLAARSAAAVKDSAEMIESSIRTVNDGTSIANKTAKALEEISSNVASVSSLVNQISIASREQSQQVEQINYGINQLSSVVQNTSATSEETASASEELAEQADSLNKEIRKFTLR